MAELPTADEGLRMVLDIFKARKLQPGEGMLLNSQQGLRTSGILIGLKAGMERGLFKNGPNGFVMLTEAGSAEL
ncbi:MAG: hypothetical protein Q8N10_07665 [Phenylobacterium sp.]|uniref:hypothetical protein n=1 Tax=Phenylobacterium sp. TaxID=1871053 RepID=UPI002727427B|nr:hypothetical protein [Phenylobacterium sp.]MDO8913959.1 hypothetical protein [Phenylobacterium sp.]MDO9248506.1 hypothetical protein [Phenylobacterium sp.]MDP3100358.1 hypothetical protein [Phenylobacterium sp.]MDP3866785.1 hypothetical protein [Phenylobacterium sp.]HQT52546.1 hypothetical protein [Phenylobacterium sp.]